MLNRRDLTKAGGALRFDFARRAWSTDQPARHPSPRLSRAINALQLEPFVDPLPLPHACPAARRPLPASPCARFGSRCTVTFRRRGFGVTDQRPLVPRSKPAVTRIWLVEWHNHLPPRHFLPIDYSLHGSGRELPESRAVVHLHGGRTPAADDGYPEHWYPRGESRVCHYPNRQDAAMLWYHDHAMGTSRLNLYAGTDGRVSASR